MGEASVVFSTPSNEQWDVFLSHSSKDKVRVRQLKTALSSLHLRVWFDEEQIGIGESIPLAVERGIEQSKVVLLCLSPNFLESAWTTAERAAFTYDDPANAAKTVLPVLFHDCVLPRTLRHLKRIDYRRHSKKAIEEIVSAVTAHTEIELNFDHESYPQRDSIEERLDAIYKMSRTSGLAAAIALASECLSSVLDTPPAMPGKLVLEFRARTYLARLLVRFEHWDEALRVVDQQVSKEFLTNHPGIAVDILCERVLCLAHHRRFPEADASLELARQTVDDPENSMSVIEAEGSLALAKEDTTEAIRIFRRLRKCFDERAITADGADKASALQGAAVAENNIGMAYMRSGNPQEAVKAFRKALELLNPEDYPFDRATFLCNLAEGLGRQEYWQRALKAATDAIRVSLESGFATGLVRAAEIQARVHAELEEYDAAAKDLEHAAEHSTSDVQKIRLLRMRSDLAVVRLHFEEALRYLSHAKIIARRIDEVNLVNRLHNQEVLVARSAMKSAKRVSGDWVSAIKFLGRHQPLIDGEFEAEAVEDHLTEQVELATTLREQCDAVFKLGRFLISHQQSRQKGVSWLTQARDTADSLGDKDLCSLAALYIVYAEFGTETAGHSARQLALAAARTIANPSHELDIMIAFVAAVDAITSSPAQDAYELIEEARAVASENKAEAILDQLEKLSSDFLPEARSLLLPIHTLFELNSERVELESWYPAVAMRLRMLWWWAREDDVLRNILVFHGTKALILSNGIEFIMCSARTLSRVFDLSCFSTYTNSPRDGEPSFHLVPVPVDMELPLMPPIVMLSPRDERFRPSPLLDDPPWMPYSWASYDADDEQWIDQTCEPHASALLYRGLAIHEAALSVEPTVSEDDGGGPWWTNTSFSTQNRILLALRWCRRRGLWLVAEQGDVSSSPGVEGVRSASVSIPAMDDGTLTIQAEWQKLKKLIARAPTVDMSQAEDLFDELVTLLTSLGRLSPNGAIRGRITLLKFAAADGATGRRDTPGFVMSVDNGNSWARNKSQTTIRHLETLDEPTTPLLKKFAEIERINQLEDPKDILLESLRLLIEEGPSGHGEIVDRAREFLASEDESLVQLGVHYLVQADDAGSADAACALGFHYSRHGDQSMALDCYRRADVRGSATAAAVLGRQYLDDFDQVAAHNALIRADERGSGIGASNLGDYLATYHHDRIMEAEEAWHRAIQRGEIHASTNLSRSLTERGEVDEAERVLLAADDEGDPLAPFLYGFHLIARHGDPDEIEAAFDRAQARGVELSNISTLISRLRLRHDTDHDAEPEEDLEVGIHMLRAGLVEASIQWLKRSLSNGCQDAMVPLGDAFLRVGDIANGVAALEKAAKSTGDPTAWKLLADHYNARGDDEQAVKALRVAAEHGSESAFFSLIGKQSLAGLTVLEEEGNTEAADLIGLIYTYRGRRSTSRTDLERAAHYFDIAARTGSSAAALNLAQVYIALGGQEMLERLDESLNLCLDLNGAEELVRLLLKYAEYPRIPVLFESFLGFPLLKRDDIPNDISMAAAFALARMQLEGDPRNEQGARFTYDMIIQNGTLEMADLARKLVARLDADG